MKKRLTATVMTVAMIAGCLSACGGNDSNTNSNANAGTSGGETTNAAADSGDECQRLSSAGRQLVPAG